MAAQAVDPYNPPKRTQAKLEAPLDVILNLRKHL